MDSWVPPIIPLSYQQNALPFTGSGGLKCLCASFALNSVELLVGIDSFQLISERELI